MSGRRWIYVEAALLTCLIYLTVVLPTLAWPHVDGIWLALALVPLAALGGYTTVVRRQVIRQAEAIVATATMSHDWVWESDDRDRITYANEAVTSLLGYEATALVGVPTEELLYDDGERDLHAQLREELRVGTPGPQCLTLDWRHADGHRVRLEGRVALIRDHRHHVVGFRGTRRAAADPTDERERLAAMRTRLLEVMAGRHFDIALQPIVNLTTAHTVGAEALARFHDGRSPDVWFGEAADCGLSRELEEMTFFAALPLLRAVPDPTYVSINASPELLLDPVFREQVLGSRQPLDRLVIEITEHVCVVDYDLLIEALVPLRVAGVRFAIDDTGAGYASLSHVLQLTPDIIKLDRSLLARLDSDRARRSLITALVLLAIDIGATVTGEGVESVAQREILDLLGVDNVQGYHLSPPSTDRAVWDTWHGAWWAVEGHAYSSAEAG